ncbi:hypothetical protein C8R47DRAFT_404967 [Mycena vitilis]|nr:hypothetical protein C8R47DRAFT_404967 [Mycena vitilis]
MTARPHYNSTFRYPSTSAGRDARELLLSSPTPPTSSPADPEMASAIDRLALKFSRLSLVEPPVHRVPDDFLYDLFMFLVGDPSSQSCDTAIRLSHVCQDWRSIVVQAPLFWRYITLHSTGSLRDHSLVVDSLLRRSQNHQISFSLYLREIDFWTDAFTQTLHPHAHRFRTLRVSASDFISLKHHLLLLASLSLISLQYHEAFVRSDRVPGAITAVSCLPNTETSSFKPLLTCANLAIPSLPHCHFVHVSLPRSIRHLRHCPDSTVHTPAPETIFQCRYDPDNDPDISPRNHWDLIAGRPIRLRELRSLALGYQDEFALVPFLHRVRLPSLEALSLQNFALSQDPDIPGELYGIRIIQGIQPTQRMPLLLSTLLATLNAPHLLRSLRLIGLRWSVEDADPTDIFYRLGPHLRSLRIVDCQSHFLPVLAEAMLASASPWQLERLTVRGMDGGDLLKCLEVRAQMYPPLKELSLEPHKRTPPCETLEQFAEVVNILELTYF